MKCKSACLLVLLGVLMVGCGGGQVKPTFYPDAPEWVRKGSGAFLNENQSRIFYGVAASSGVRNKALAIQTADNRARNEVAKIFDVYVASIMKDYQAATTAGDFTASTEEQHVEQAIKTVTSTTLSGVLIIDHWQDTNGDIFSLARLDLDQFGQNMDKMKELNGQVRDFVRKNAERLHDELKQEADSKK